MPGSKTLLSIAFAFALLVAAVGCSDDEALRLANAEVAKGNETIASLNEQVAKGNATIDALNEDLAKADAEVVRGNEGIASLNAQLSGANGTIEELAGANAEWEQEYGTLTVAHDTLTATHNALAQQKAELETALADIEAEHATVQEALTKAEKNLAILRGAAGRANTLDERAGELEEEIAELQGQHRALTDEYARLRSAYQSFLEQRCAIRSDQTPYTNTIHDISYDLLVPSDPTSLKSVDYVGRGERRVWDSRLRAGRGDWVSIDAYLFRGLYSDATVEFRVNPEFGSMETALEQVDKFAAAFGRIPAMLLSRVESVVIHKDGGVWAANWHGKFIHLTVDGDEHIRRGTLEEVFIHEAVHASLDGAHRNSAGWREAQMKDCVFISSYARDNPDTEDVAESFLAYFALRYLPDRLTESDKAAIRNAIPNRIAYFDEQGFDLSTPE